MKLLADNLRQIPIRFSEEAFFRRRLNSGSQSTER